MKLFTCLLDPEDYGIDDNTRRSYDSLLRARGYEVRWQSHRQVAVLTVEGHPYQEPLVATLGDHVGVGMVRLDNRREIDGLAGPFGPELSDLEVVLRVISQYGTRYIPKFLGDFALVVWDPQSGTAVVASDALAIKKLYFAQRARVLAFSSRAETLALSDAYEVQYLAECVALCAHSPQLTPYVGVRQIPAATIGVFQGRSFTLSEYWSPEQFDSKPLQACSEREAAESCFGLLAASLKARVSGRADTWAQLSGGVDSSSIVCLAQYLAERGELAHGLAGTVTFVDRQATDADEREYSDAVVQRWGIRNEKIIEPPFWLDSRVAPPLLDQPLETLPFYPREYELCTKVRSAGGRVLLTGFGGDELFTGNSFFLADWVVRGHCLRALREMAHRAALCRLSFWGVAHRNVLLPLLPTRLRHRLLPKYARLQPWLAQSVVRRYELEAKAIGASIYAGRLGRKYRHALVTSVGGIGRGFDSGWLADTLDVRHPFLYRPLVEFALQLPPELVVRPHARKWVLRESMRGVLPESVRCRVGKGGPGDLLAWALDKHRRALEPLVQRPILADLGVVDAGKLRQAFEAAPFQSHREGELHVPVQLTLIVEAWLQIRSGRWPCGFMMTDPRRQDRALQPSI